MKHEKIESLISLLRELISDEQPTDRMTLESAVSFFNKPEFDETSSAAKNAREVIAEAQNPKTGRLPLIVQRIPAVPVSVIEARIAFLLRLLETDSPDQFVKTQGAITELRSIIKTEAVDTIP